MTQWRLLIVLQPIVIYCYNLRNHIQLTLRNSAWVGFQPGTLVVFELLGADSNHSAIHLRFMPKVSSEQFDLISLITVVLKQTFNWSCFSPNVYFAWTQQKVNWIFFPSSLRKIWLTFSQEKKHPPHTMVSFPENHANTKKIKGACNLSKKKNRTLGFIAMVRLKKRIRFFG